MNKKIIIFFLLTFVILGVFLRINIFGDDLLWQDEAETTINSLQVLDVGYPHGTFEGKPLYENASYILSDDPKYEYESTNYYGSKYERNKGWLTFYYQAIFLKIFGFSTTSARLPFILLFPLSLLLLYLLSKKLFNEKVGLIAAGLYTVNYYSFFYEGQARYYSLTIFIAIFCLYVFYFALTTQKWRYYLLSSLGLILMFYTNIVACLAIGVFFILIHLYYHKKIKSLLDLKLIVANFLVLVFTVPWLFLVNFWVVLTLFPNNDMRVLWLLVVVVFIFAYFFIKYFLPKFFSHKLNVFGSLNYILLFIGCIVIIKPFIAPEESVASRLFIEAVPIFGIVFAYIIYRIFYFKFWRSRRIIYNFTPLVLLFFIFLVLSYSTKMTKSIYETEWVKKTIEYLDEQDIPETALILVNYQHFSFMLYTDSNIELIWPLRKSYIDNYPDEIYFIIDYNFFHPNIFYREKKLSLKDLNYYKRIKECSSIMIYKDTYLYDCPAKLN